MIDPSVQKVLRQVVTVKNRTTPFRFLVSSIFSMMLFFCPKTVEAQTLGQGQAYFMIVNKNSGKCLSLIGEDTGNGVSIVQGNYDYNRPAQRWATVPTEGFDHFKLISWINGKCLCIDQDSTVPGAMIHDWDYVGNNPAQQFDFIDAGNGWYKIRNVKSGLVLDVSHNSTADKATVLQWTDKGTSPNQLWRFQARPADQVSLPTGNISSHVLAWDADSKEQTISGGIPEAHFVFTLTNVSQHDVTLVNAVTSCGCTVAKLPEGHRISPGASSKVDVTMNLKDKFGTETKTVTISTDKGIKVLHVTVHLPDAHSHLK